MQYEENARGGGSEMFQVSALNPRGAIVAGFRSEEDITVDLRLLDGPY